MKSSPGHLPRRSRLGFLRYSQSYFVLILLPALAGLESTRKATGGLAVMARSGQSASLRLII
jgi:hypothetical protein